MADKQNNNNQMNKLLAMLDSDNLDDRLVAIRILGDQGDQQTLSRLREKLPLVSKEMEVLIIAIGKLKRRLGVK